MKQKHLSHANSYTCIELQRKSKVEMDVKSLRRPVKRKRATLENVAVKVGDQPTGITFERQLRKRSRRVISPTFGDGDGKEVLPYTFPNLDGPKEYSDDILQTYAAGLQHSFNDVINVETLSKPKYVNEEKMCMHTQDVKIITPTDFSPTAQKSGQHEEECKSKGKGEMKFNLEKQMVLTVSSIKDEVDIRYLNDDLRRTVKGLKLSISQFKAIVNNLSPIDEMFKKVRAQDLLEDEELEINKSIHLGGVVWMYITSPFQTVNIRKKYRHKSGELRAGRDGVSLKWITWQRFINVCHTILASGILSINSGLQ